MEHNAEYYFKQATAHFRSGDFESGAQHLARAIELDPTNLAYRWYRSGDVYAEEFNAARYRMAVDDLSTIVNLSSDLDELKRAYSELSVLHDILGQGDDVLADLNWLIEHGFGTANWHTYRGEYRLQFGDVEGAMDDFTTAHQMAPRKTRSLMGRAQAHYLSHRYDKAIDDLNTVLRLDKRKPQSLIAAHHLRGKAYYQLGEHDKALADFNAHMRLLDAEPFSSATDYMRMFAPGELA